MQKVKNSAEREMKNVHFDNDDYVQMEFYGKFFVKKFRFRRGFRGENKNR